MSTKTYALLASYLIISINCYAEDTVSVGPKHPLFPFTVTWSPATIDEATKITITAGVVSSGLFTKRDRISIGTENENENDKDYTITLQKLNVSDGRITVKTDPFGLYTHQNQNLATKSFASKNFDTIKKIVINLISKQKNEHESEKYWATLYSILSMRITSASFFNDGGKAVFIKLLDSVPKVSPSPQSQKVEKATESIAVQSETLPKEPSKITKEITAISMPSTSETLSTSETVMRSTAQPGIPQETTKQQTTAREPAIASSSAAVQPNRFARLFSSAMNMGKYVGRAARETAYKANLIQKPSPEEKYLLPTNLNAHSFTLGWDGTTPERSHQFTFSVEESMVPRGEVGRYVSGTDKKVIGVLYQYRITINQNSTSPLDYSLQMTSSFQPEESTAPEIKNIAMIEIKRATPITKDQYGQIKKSVIEIDREAGANRERLKSIMRDEEPGLKLQKIKLHNMLVTIVNRMKEEKTLGSEIKTPEGISYRIILFEVFKGLEQLNLYKEQAKNKKEKMSFLTFLSKTISKPTSYQENLSRYHSKAGAGWMEQVKKLDETSISDRILEIAGNTYLLANKFDNTSNANLGDHYEIYLVSDDSCIVDLFIDIVALSIEKYSTTVDFIALRLTPGVSYTRNLKSGGALPRIIVGLKPSKNKTETEDIIQRIRTIIATKNYKGIQTKPRYSAKVSDEHADFVYAAHGGIAYKDTAKGADEYKAHMPYKNKDDQLFKETTTSFFDTIIESAQKAKSYTDAMKFWKWKWRK